MQPHILKLNDHKYINISAINVITVSDETKSVSIWFRGGNDCDMVLYMPQEIQDFLSYLDKIAFRLEE